MNSRDKVMSRVLNLFPVQIVKETFEKEGPLTEELLEEIVRNAKDIDIFEFTRNNLGFTKQHVYISTHDIEKLGELPEHLLTENTIRSTENDIIEYWDLYDVTYKVYLQEPYEVVNLEFKWPIWIVISNSIIAIHFTILEKNIQSYFDERAVLTARKSVEEKDIIELIVTQLSNYGIIEPYDLNKGIKELWKQDIIDALEVQYRKSKSVSKETMDEEYTFKKQYPGEYEKAIQAPLKKSIFKFIRNKNKYCDHFTIDPSLGKITFPTFSKKKEHSQNVIRKILELN